MPVLDKPDFMRRYRYLMDNKHDGQQVRAQAPFVALICSVFAVASRFVEDPRLITSDNPDEAGMGMVYHERYVPFLFAAIPSNFLWGAIQCPYFALHEQCFHARGTRPRLPPDVFFPVFD